MSKVNVFKFGGSCLKQSNDIDAIVQRISESNSEKTVVIVSAIYGITDRILQRLENNDPTSIPAFVASLEMVHLELSPTLVNNMFHNQFQEALRQLTVALNKNAVKPDDESRTIALISGERMSSVTIAAALSERGIQSAPCWADEIGISIKSEKNESVVDLELTEKKLTLPAVEVPVVTGWFGVHDGEIALLARGGSDLTATALASILNAAEVTIWRDVPGVLALAPRWSIPSRNLPYLSYTEAQELALFSEPMLHPYAVKPLRKKGIPLRLRPLHDPHNAGSCIGPSVASGEARVQAVGCLPHLVPLTMKLSGVMSVAKVVGDATRLLERARIRVWSLRARPSEARFLVSERFASRAIRLLSENPGLPTPKRGDSLAILCLVGESIGVTADLSEQIVQMAFESGLEFTKLDEGRRNHALHYTVNDRHTQDALMLLASKLDLLVPA